MGILDDYRRQNPQYRDISNNELADAMYTKFYSTMPREEFDGKVGYAPTLPRVTPQSMADEVATAFNPLAKTPLQIRDMNAEMSGSTFTPEQIQSAGTQVQAGELTDAMSLEGEGAAALLRRRGQQFMRGATEVVASMPEGAAIAGRGVALNRLESVLAAQPELQREHAELSAIIAEHGADSYRGRAAANRLEAVKMEVMRADRMAAEDTASTATPIHETTSFLEGQKIRDASLAQFGTPNADDTGLWGQVAEGAGNMTVMALSALAGPGGLVVGGLEGSAMNTAQVYKEVIEAGGTEEEALHTSKVAALIGASEIIPIGRAMDLIPPALRPDLNNKFIQKISDILQSSGEEGAQEYLATVANNANAIYGEYAYDAERGLLDGAGQAAIVGVILGGGMGTPGALMRGRSDGPTTPNIDGSLQSPAAPDETPNIGAIRTPKRDDEPDRAMPEQPVAPDAPQPAPQTPQDIAQELASAAEQAPIPASSPHIPDQQAAPVVPKTPEQMAEQLAAAPEAPVAPAGEVADAPERGQFKADDWQELQGQVGGEATGRTFMENTVTGEVVPRVKFDALVEENRAPDVQEAAPARPAAPDAGPAPVPQDLAGDIAAAATDKPAAPVAPEVGEAPTPDVEPAPKPEVVTQTPAKPLEDIEPAPEVVTQTPAKPLEDIEPAPEVVTEQPTGILTQKQVNAALPEGINAVRRDAENTDQWTLLGEGSKALGTFNSTDPDGVDAATLTRMQGVAERGTQQPAPDAAPTAETDPAFQAAKDSGKLEVVSVTPETESVDVGDRSMADAGTHWDGMTPAQRVDFLTEMNPKSSPDTRKKFGDMGWADFSQNVQSKITTKLPESAFPTDAARLAGEQRSKLDAKYNKTVGNLTGTQREAYDWAQDQDGGTAYRFAVRDGNVEQFTAKYEIAKRGMDAGFPAPSGPDFHYNSSDVKAGDKFSTMTGQPKNSKGGATYEFELLQVADDAWIDAQNYMIGSGGGGYGLFLRTDPYKTRADAINSTVIEKRNTFNNAATATYSSAKTKATAKKVVAEIDAWLEENGETPTTTPDVKLSMREEAEAALPDGYTLIQIKKRANDYHAIVERKDNKKRQDGTGTTPGGAVETAVAKLEVEYGAVPKADAAKPKKVTQADFDKKKAHGYTTERPDGSKAMLELGDKGTTLTPVEIATKAAQADTNPTDAQKEQGNYKMGHISWMGLDITIENAKGSERSGTDQDGESWSVTMPAHYGYIKRTEGADGDHVDVYMGEYPDSAKVFVIDQVNLDRTFDEHKIMLGFNSSLLARGTHAKAFSDGLGEQRRGGVTEMTVAEFREWLENGDQSQPLSADVKKAAPESAAKVQQGGSDPATAASQPDTATDDVADQPTVALGNRLAALMGTDGYPKTNIQLMKMAAEDFGGTIAEGAFSPKDAYEAMELGMNLWIKKKNSDPSVDKVAAKLIVNQLQTATDALPTQTRRDTETDAFQQFSTPPSYAFAANWVANIQMGEQVLEPSAGNGGIAIFAKNAGAKVDVNELAERRVPSLKALDFDRVTTENAEQIGNIWAKDSSRKYDVVVMNPPFSASGSRGTSNTSATGAQHIKQALGMLKPGGRLVAIMGHTFRPSNSRVSKFFTGLDGKYTVQANVEVNGSKVYVKYGTSYDNRILVIDKMPEPEGHKVLGGRAENIPDLIDMMEDVRNVANNRDTKTNANEADGEVAAGEAVTGSVETGGDAGTGKPKRVSKPDDLGSQTDGAGRVSNADTADGKPTGANEGSATIDAGRKSKSVDEGTRAGGSSGTITPDRKRSTLREDEVTAVEETSGGFAKYRPSRVRINNAVEHPMQLVESAAMASVNPPKPNYEIQVPDAMIKKGLLSESQLEVVVYAGAAHSEMLEGDDNTPARRKGIMIGDGTGVGKTREIAGIIADNWAQGRKKHVLISKDKKLLKGARRDFDNVGMKNVPIADLGATKADAQIPSGTQGVMFATYSTIGRNAPAGKQSRLDQLLDWLGPDFDGTITFDESHLAGNALAVKGKRGTTKPSSTALAVVELQNKLPNARIVYASATAATEVYNLAYANRLGLWGPGTPFPTVNSFVEQINKGGIAAMEVVARDMKQIGVYIARNLSFDGVEYAKVEHELTVPQREMYDAAAEAWQTILQDINTVIQEHTKGEGRQRGAALAQFWGTHQRFFGQVLTSMQMPTIIKNIEADIKAGMSPVIQLVNTNEAATKRAMSKLGEGDTLDDIDISPREDIIQYLETSFPVMQFEQYTDDDGNLRARPVQDSNGDFVQNAEAVDMRDALVDKLASMTLPGNPLDMIVDKFGPDNVAEVTGRSLRVINKNGKKVSERRSQSKALAEAHEFQAGKRKLLVFSDAGGTGMDFHADKSAKNTARRAHYVLQAGWRADKAIQGFGRTHRTNQTQPPVYKLAGTNLSGHKRFTSSIARRLDQLGALTKGQSDTGGGGMFNATDNLENEFADAAVLSLFIDVYAGKVDGFTAADLDQELGIKIVGESGFNKTKVPSVPQFLNRLLNVTIDRQNLLFDKFIEHMEISVQTAIDNGEYTAGVEELTHDGAVLEDTKEAYRDETTGATSEYRQIKLTQKVMLTSFADLNKHYKNLTFKKNDETGKVYAFRSAANRTNDRGEVIPTYHRHSASNRTIIDSDKYRYKYTMVQADEAKAAWKEQINDAPRTREETRHLITGALLPIWDRLPSTSPKIVRLSLDDGRSLLGREIPSLELEQTLANLGVDAPEINLTSKEVQAAVMDGKTIMLSSGHKIERRRVGGDLRIEVTSPPNDYTSGQNLRGMGFNVERIQYKNRAFAATGEAGTAPIDRLMAGKRIVSVSMNKDQQGKRSKTGMIRPYENQTANSPVFKKFRAEMDKFGLQQVELQFDPSIGGHGAITADFFGKMQITIGDTLNPKWTMAHESIHAYRHMGVFTKAEWAVLELEAKSTWMKRYDIKRRYRDLTLAEQYEEAIAEAFGEAFEKRGQFRTTSPARAALRKINQFLKAVRSWAKGLGMVTPADVLEGMARGEFSKRKAIDGWKSQTERLMKEQRKNIPSNHGGMYLPDRYIWDTLAHGNGNIFSRIRQSGGALADRFDWARTRIQDRFLPVMKAQQVIERETGGKTPEDLDAYLAEEMYSGRTGHKLDQIDLNYTTPIIKIIGNTEGLTTETVGQYLYARHAAERNDRIAEINEEIPEGGSGMDTAEAKAILDAIEASPQASAYAEIGKLIDQLREETIDERVDMGLMKDFEAKAWRKSYKYYVPLKGWAETDHADAELDVTGIGRGYNTRGQETKRALGRKTTAYNPLVAALTQAQEVVVRAEKNRVGQHLYRLARDVPAKEMWSVKRVETKRVFNESTGLVETRSMQPITLIMAANEMAVKVDGEEHRITFTDPRLARAATRVGVDGLGTIMKILSPFSRYISMMNTMMDPEFVVRNFVRDTVTANITIQAKEQGSKIQKGMMRDLPKALKGAYRGMGGKADTEWSKYYQEYSRVGGKVSFWVIENPESSGKLIEKRMKREAGGVKGTALALVTPSVSLNPVLKAVERINLAVDNAIRLAAFVHARKNGMSEQQAASLSKNMTVNFNRRGDHGSAINAAYVFANAALQGSHVLLKSLKSNKVKLIVTGMMVLGFMLDQANAYLSEEDEDGQLAYDKIPDYKHETNLVVMAGKGGDAVTLWLPYGFNLFPYIGNRISQALRGKVTPMEAATQTAGVAFNAFSPVNGSSFMSMVTPTILDPALDIATNQDWLGRDIYPDYPNMTEPDSQRFFGSATNASRIAAEKVNQWTGGTYAESGFVDVSPETIDHISSYLMGGLGRTGGRMVDLFAKAFGGNADELETNDIPFVRTLYTDTGEWMDRSVYFDRRNEVRAARNAAKAYIEHGDPVPEDITWLANLYNVQLSAERYRRGTTKVAKDEARAYLLLNTAYVNAWKANTPYSSDSIFGAR